MKRLVRLEWAFFAALCLLLATSDPAGRIVYAAAALAISLICCLIFSLLRKLLTPIFQVLSLLVLTSTLFEVLHFMFPFSFDEILPQAIFSSFLISISSQKNSEKIEIGILFLFFILTSVLFFRVSAIFSDFYPAIFLLAVFLFAGMSALYSLKAKKHSMRKN